MANLEGSNYNDILKGTLWPDYIFGYGGNDVLYGGAGNDRIEGGAGNDAMYGEANDDYMMGGEGNDTLVGGTGNDYLMGDSGSDRIYGQDGDDVLNGGYNNDPNDGDDYLDGGAGNDYLKGWIGKNTYIGGAGNDADQYIIEGGNNTIIDNDDTTAIDLVLIKKQISWDFLRVGRDLHIIDVNDANHLTVIKNYFNYAGYAYRKDLSINGELYSLGGMQFYPNMFETWVGTAGADVMRTSNLADTVEAGNGNDVVYGYLGIDRISGGAGNDVLSGGGGADTLNGDAGNDTLYGDAGNDELYGGTGNDADTYVVTAGSGFDQAYDVDDTTAIDTIKFSGIASTKAKFTRDGWNLGINGYGQSSDGVVVWEYFNPTLFAHNKRFVFSDKTLTLSDMQSGKYRFTLNGTAAAETLYGSKVADAIYGLNGNDILYGYEGNDVLQGGLGNDSLYGHAGNDGLNGNAGNDVLGGGEGDDALYGGSSNDTDIYLFQAGAGKDMVIDTDDTTATDSLRFSNINSTTATFSKSGKDLVVKYGAGNDQVTVKQFYDTSVKAGRKQFQFADKTITAAQVPALLQQAQALKAAVAGLSSKESAIVVQASTASNIVNLAAAV